MGVEVYDKTLGVIGIGNIGMIVAEKGVALGMKVIAYDLYVAKEVAAQKGIELVDLDTLLARSDFITVHVPMLKETKNLINKDNLAKTKKGVFIINAARGGIVNEKDLYDAIEERPGRRGGPRRLRAGAAAQGPSPGPFRQGGLHAAPRRIDKGGAEQGRHRHRKPDRRLRAQRGDKEQRERAARLHGGTRAALPVPRPLREARAVRLPHHRPPIKEVEIEYSGAIAEVETKILTQGIMKSILTAPRRRASTM